MYILRKLETKDLEKVDIMIEKAKKNMRDVLKIDQWQSGYPNKETYEKDISDGIGYAFCNEADEIVAVAAVILGNEPWYDKIEKGEFDGVWKGDEESYAAIHRVCVDLDSTCRGIGSSFIGAISKYCKKRGKTSLRIDTHRLNKPMRSMLKKCGFYETGIIHIPEVNTTERITYEMII
ncbi:MAG: GNAT family N-acetyltransferase [Ruminococcaceae bacterium]|nr:GNAT family N-acetyltransferase [Oscillospiraceae bacterium]